MLSTSSDVVVAGVDAEATDDVSDSSDSTGASKIETDEDGEVGKLWTWASPCR